MYLEETRHEAYVFSPKKRPVQGLYIFSLAYCSRKLENENDNGNGHGIPPPLPSPSPSPSPNTDDAFENCESESSCLIIIALASLTHQGKEHWVHQKKVL